MRRILTETERIDLYEKGLCRGVLSTNAFFPERGAWGEESKGITAVCRECPVRKECLLTALEQGVTNDFGIYGGLSEKARRHRIRPQITKIMAWQRLPFDKAARKAVDRICT